MTRITILSTEIVYQVDDNADPFGFGVPMEPLPGQTNESATINLKVRIEEGGYSTEREFGFYEIDATNSRLLALIRQALAYEDREARAEMNDEAGRYLP